MSYGLPINCPPWADDIPANRENEFAAIVRTAIALAIASARTELLSGGAVKYWHLTLFESFVPVDYYAGNFRQDDAARPCLGTPVSVGGINGAAFQDVLNRMDRLLENLRISIGLTELHWAGLPPPERARRVAVIIAAGAGEFIRIHPFVNGNGRTSRLLWRWALHRFGVPAHVRITPRPEQPYGVIMANSMQGNDGPLAIEVLRHLAQNPPAQIVTGG
jgi:fido (protein-threonine AMPylation protein)